MFRPTFLVAAVGLTLGLLPPTPSWAANPPAAGRADPALAAQVYTTWRLGKRTGRVSATTEDGAPGHCYAHPTQPCYRADHAHAEGAPGHQYWIAERAGYEIYDERGDLAVYAYAYEGRPQPDGERPSDLSVVLVFRHGRWLSDGPWIAQASTTFAHEIDEMHRLISGPAPDSPTNSAATEQLRSRFRAATEENQPAPH